ncbi:MAG: phospholipase D-like domain-containing protein [Muribaculum sp.]|nr:phospholipase D-like domain-containing protein [Muribaculum sp.]
MQETHFSNIAFRVTELLDNAKKSVDIAMAWFTNAALFEAALACLKRGINVRLVLLDSPINFMEYAPDFNQFVQLGGQLHIATSSVGFMHHKFCIVDEEYVVNGSYNWTYFAETRNVENILISDDAAVVAGFKQEFSRLICAIQKSAFVPRLSMSDIEERNDVNYRELNEEIANICKVQNRPIKRVFETKTQVIIKETKLTPAAKWNIGIVDDNNKIQKLILAGTELPCSSQNLEMYLDTRTESSCNLCIAIEDPKDVSKNSPLMDEDIMRVARGATNANLPIKFIMQLDDAGLLRIDVVCAESGQTMTLSKLDKDLVKYV